MDKMEWQFKWFDWCIEVECPCGEVLEIMDGDENPYPCEGCKRSYTWDLGEANVKDFTNKEKKA